MYVDLIYMYKAEMESFCLFQEIPWLVEILEGEGLRECSWTFNLQR